MYSNETYERIMERMLNRISNKYDKREGGVLWLAIAPAAAEFAQAYIQADRVLNESFADTASYEYLRRRAAERGIYPYPATNAIVKGEFNLDVPIGSRFSYGNIIYVVLSKIDDFHFEMMCEQKGTIGNEWIGDIIPVSYVGGLQFARIVEILIPARNLEDVEDFRRRYLDSFDSQAFGGNKKDYQEKVNALNGVGGCKIIPIWNGGGTVKVIIIDSTLKPPSSQLVEFVQNELDPVGHSGLGVGIAPIGHVVTVVGVTSHDIAVTSTIELDSGYDWDTIKPQIETAINSYFEELSKDWTNLDNDGIIVRIALVDNSILSVDGVIDVTGTLLNGQASNITLTNEEIPSLVGVVNV